MINLTLAEDKGTDQVLAAPISSLMTVLNLCIKEAERLFDKYLEQQRVLNHGVFNLQEAAMYCRFTTETMEYHANRTRKVTPIRARTGLVFLKQDLDSFLASERAQTLRDPKRRNDHD